MIIEVGYNNNVSNHNFILKFIGHKDNNAGWNGIRWNSKYPSIPKQSLK